MDDEKKDTSMEKSDNSERGVEPEDMIFNLDMDLEVSYMDMLESEEQEEFEVFKVTKAADNVKVEQYEDGVRKYMFDKHPREFKAEDCEAGCNEEMSRLLAFKVYNRIRIEDWNGDVIGCRWVFDEGRGGVRARVVGQDFNDGEG